MTPTPPPLQKGDALFLDFDGTIVELAARPDLVSVPPHLPETLHALQGALHSALAIVTGRRFSDVQDYLQPLVLPGIGQHGAELCTSGGPSRAAAAGVIEKDLRSPGRGYSKKDRGTRAGRFALVLGTAAGVIEKDLRSPALVLGTAESPRVHEAVAALRKRFEGVPGVLIEDKGLSVSLHYRNAPEREPDCESAMQTLAVRFDLSTLRGKQVIEMRASPVTKGDGIRALMELSGFRGRRPVFAGDDITDEYGFKAVDALGGSSIKVGVGDSEARYALTDVAAVHRWLERSLQHLSVIPAQAGI